MYQLPVYQLPYDYFKNRPSFFIVLSFSHQNPSHESFYEPFGMKLPGNGITSNRLILDELKTTLPDKINKNRRLARKKQLYPNLDSKQLDKATLDMEKYIEEAKGRKKESDKNDTEYR